MIRTSLTLWIVIIAGIACAQVKVGEVLIISQPELKPDVDPNTFEAFVTDELIPELSKKNVGTSYNLLKADRGDRKGKFLFVRSIEKIKDRKVSNGGDPTELVHSGDEGLQVLITNPKMFAEYHLIGAEKIDKLPTSGILGLHFIKVKEDRAQEFDKLVVEKLHPAVSHLFSDMQLLYYKCVGGENAGTYLTLFTIDSPKARDKYWPEGAPETEVLRKTFKSIEYLAKELGTYLVPGSYLEPESGGAAAYWESKEWTDYVHSLYHK
jgi:hypothetical protein